MKLSDKILIIFVIFATILVILARFLLGGSLQQVLLLSNFIYIAAFLTTYFIGRKFSREIGNLITTVREMTTGDISGEIRVKGKDEIGQLANALNGLISGLKTKATIEITKHKAINKAKTDFVALASHQLRSPLSVTKWYIEFLLNEESGSLNREQKKYLKEVYQSNENLIDLVNALLDVSRIDLGTFYIEPELTDIAKKAESALKEFLPEIKAKNIKIEKKYDKLPTLNLDPRLSRIFFENIISNSVKYTPENGVIRITIKKVEPNVLIKISDTGCGIPREEQAKMFSKFFRGSNAIRKQTEGTGLGLYIVKAVVEQFGGKIWFESPSLDLFLKKGQKASDLPVSVRKRGTTFFITIPFKGMKRKKGSKELTNKG